MPTKFLHTRLRVSDLQRSIDWYTQNCGFQVVKRTDKSPAGNMLAHLEIPGNDHQLELTYSPKYEVKFPEDLIHTCIGVDDIVAYCDKLEKLGTVIWPDGWRQKFTGPDARKMAFITDPDGYEVEILENK